MIKSHKEKVRAAEHLAGHKPLLDFLDLRFIEQPSLKRSQFTLQENRGTQLGGESTRKEKHVSTSQFSRELRWPDRQRWIKSKC